MKKSIAGLIAALGASALLLGAAPAKASNVQWSISVGTPAPAVIYAPPVVHAPPRVVVQPQVVYIPSGVYHPPVVHAYPHPVYVQPRPIFVQPPPVYVHPAPVYYKKPQHNAHRHTAIKHKQRHGDQRRYRY